MRMFARVYCVCVWFIKLNTNQVVDVLIIFDSGMNFFLNKSEINTFHYTLVPLTLSCDFIFTSNKMNEQ